MRDAMRVDVQTNVDRLESLAYDLLILITFSVIDCMLRGPGIHLHYIHQGLIPVFKCYMNGQYALGHGRIMVVLPSFFALFIWAT